MNTIRPKTYHEIVTFRRCASLKRYLPNLDNETFRKIYDLLIAAKEHTVSISGGKICFYAKGSRLEDSMELPNPMQGIGFSTIALSSQIWNVTSPYSRSGSGGDSGSSGNNNNNNNNNNNG